jgi:hypothetical protein
MKKDTGLESFVMEGSHLGLRLFVLVNGFTLKTTCGRCHEQRKYCASQWRLTGAATTAETALLS